MNEPSVFNGPEVTMPKDKLHMNGVEHRELHNMYGHLYVMATHAGHLLRADNTQRPFILTRQVNLISLLSYSQRHPSNLFSISLSVNIILVIFISIVHLQHVKFTHIHFLVP